MTKNGRTRPATPDHTTTNRYGVLELAQVLASVSFLLFGYAAMIAATALLGIAVPLELRAGGVSTEMAGMIGTAFFLGFLAGSRFGRIAIIRVGHVRVFAGLAALSAAAALLYPFISFSTSLPIGWMVLRFINGFCLVGLAAVTESWLNDRCTNGNRGTLLGIYMVVNYFFVASGQLLVNVSPVGGSEAFMLVAFLFTLSLVPVVMTRTPSPDMGHVAPLSFRQLYSFTPLGVVGAGVSGVLTGTFFGMGALFAREIGLSVFDVSLFTASVVIGGLLFQFPVGWLSDRFGRRQVLLGVLLAIVVVSTAMMAVPALGGALPLILVLAALFGAGMTVVYPIALAHAFDHVARDRFVAASSGLLLAYAVGGTLGPALTSQVMGALGPYGFFVSMGTVSAAFAAFVVYRWYRRERSAAVGGIAMTTASLGHH